MNFPLCFACRRNPFAFRFAACIFFNTPRGTFISFSVNKRFSLIFNGPHPTHFEPLLGRAWLPGMWYVLSRESLLLSGRREVHGSRPGQFGVRCSLKFALEHWSEQSRQTSRVDGICAGSPLSLLCKQIISRQINNHMCVFVSALHINTVTIASWYYFKLFQFALCNSALLWTDVRQVKVCEISLVYEYRNCEDSPVVIRVFWPRKGMSFVWIEI